MLTEKELRKQLVEYSIKAYENGYIVGMDGNVSVRVSENTALITPSAICKADLTQDMLILVDLQGNVIKGDLKPSKETDMHLSVYKLRKDLNAVMHTHSTNVLAFALANKSIDVYTNATAAFYLGEIANVPYSMPGSEKLHQDVEQAYKKYQTILLFNHGSIVADKDLKQVYLNTEMLESFAEALLKAELLGTVKRMSQEQIDEVNLFRNKTGEI